MGALRSWFNTLMVQVLIIPPLLLNTSGGMGGGVTRGFLPIGRSQSPLLANFSFAKILADINATNIFLS